MSCKIQQESWKQEISKSYKQAEKRVDEALNMAVNQGQFMAQKKGLFAQSAYCEKHLSQKSSNQLDKGVRYQEWTHQDEERLLKLHNQKGNRWVQIAKQLDKSDNAVKNHYHSKFRKTLRKINRVVNDFFRSELKPLKNIIISKIIQTAQGLYSSKEGQSKQQAHIAFQLKNRLLSLSSVCEQQIREQQASQIKSLVSQVQKFSKYTKTKGRNKDEEKHSSNKYKGKEILSLLNQNTKVYQQNQLQAKRSSPSTYSLKNKAEKERNERKVQKINSQQPNNQGLDRQINSFHPFMFLNQGIIPMGPMFYPMFPQPSGFLFSGRHSSFSCYNGEKDGEGMANWSTATSITSIQEGKVEGGMQGDRKLSNSSL